MHDLTFLKYLVINTWGDLSNITRLMRKLFIS